MKSKSISSRYSIVKKTNMLVGKKTGLEKGYVYAPYIMATTTPTINESDGIFGIRARWRQKMREEKLKDLLDE